ncbi:MAG: FHA domain-containing protein [Gemmataceae bacterium]|nr:FHA domain-containing protein [Gemmataceae bacterium]
MPPTLLALTEGPNIAVDKPILFIGRDHECDVQIPSRKISRRHCCVAQVHDYLVVKDLFSTNGVRINGIRVREGCLRAGDELTIGNFRYKIQMNGEDAPPAAGFAPAPAPAAVGPNPPPPHPVPADPLASFENPVPLAEGQPAGPVPQGLPLVLPVNANSNPPGVGLPVQGDFRAGPPPK